MILFDLTQAVIATLVVQLSENPRTQIEDDLIRHITLNSMRSVAKKFKGKYGELVVCCDGRKYWRRDVFPQYKAHRKKDRDKSPLDWNKIFDILGKIKEELKEFAPYKVVETVGAEADDIIAVLSTTTNEPVLVVSSDKDFLQLQKYANVRQYSPLQSQFVSTDDPEAFRKEHILKGDRGDGIPNFLSPDDVFVSGGRQKSLSKQKLAEWVTMDPNDFCTTDEMKRGYERNKVLVDFDKIPADIKKSIIETYDAATKTTRYEFMNYLINHRMKLLIANLEDF